MKKYLAILFLLFASVSCKKNDDKKSPENIDFKQEMRNFVIGISQYARVTNPKFLIIPQNGIELVTDDGNADGNPNSNYLNAVDGNGQEDLFYGYSSDDKATASNEISYLKTFLDISKNAGKIILVTNYCSTHSKMDNSYIQSNDANYISFAADHRDLNDIPNYPSPIYSENNAIVSSLSGVKNFLYLINPENYSTKAEFINAITATNYDLLIMDLFFTDNIEFTSSEVDQLRTKANGGKRLVISYMSIGEAENYRYYWQADWNKNKPSWIDKENPDWAGNYKVWYWEQEWKDIIYGDDSSYLKKILNANFDGVYLDVIDAFEYFE